MIVDVLMPKMGESITEGTIVEWKKNVGDTIEKDETLLEISTDKVDSEIPCPTAGKILELLFNKNDTVEVNTVIAKIGTEDGDNVDSSSNQENIKEDEDEIPEDNNEVLPEKTDKVLSEEKIIKEMDISKDDRVFYSPLVKSIAKKEGISIEELSLIQGTGNNGRINKKDILSTPHHCSHFNIDERSLLIGASIYLNLVENILD